MIFLVFFDYLKIILATALQLFFESHAMTFFCKESCSVLHKETANLFVCEFTHKQID